jgi:NADH-quinone oxidoreductase subunit J
MDMTPSVLQIIFGGVTLLCALLVVLGKNPVVSAMALMGTLFSTGILFFSQKAYFIGAVQILIYAGAISVLFIFIVMLLDLKPLRLSIPGRMPVHVLGFLAGALILVGSLLVALPALQEPGLVDALAATGDGLEASEPLSISLRFLSKYMIPFQATALLILAAIMGVVVLGRPTRANRPEGN